MTEDNSKYPKTLLSPIKTFLKEEIERLKKARHSMVKNDPFHDESRSSENSLEEDVDEQIGHIEMQAKEKFLSRQIVQFRKALTRLKIGKYGYCEKCGVMIDTDRLAVEPEVTTCIKCSKEMDD